MQELDEKMGYVKAHPEALTEEQRQALFIAMLPSSDEQNRPQTQKPERVHDEERFAERFMQLCAEDRVELLAFAQELLRWQNYRSSVM